MSKAILVIDMPIKCTKCPLSKEINTFRGEGICCTFNNQTVDYLGKPAWCPLKEVPEKNTKQYSDSYKYGKGYQRGYNACIDDILKGSEENE